MFTDTHCHIYSTYYEDIDSVIEDSVKKGVTKYINNGCDTLSNKEVVELIHKYENMYGAIGIHPEYVSEYTNDDITYIKEKLKDDKIVAIGEIGLDYFYTKENKEEQIKLFETQLKLAQEYNLPVIVHSREATKDTIDILKKYKVKGVIHSFSGSIETANEYIKMGFLLGVNGVITFKNAHIKDVYEKIDLSNIVLETDSPYLTPEPFRGKQNNPSHIVEIAKFICDLKGISMDELSKITNDNIRRLYNF